MHQLWMIWNAQVSSQGSWLCQKLSGCSTACLIRQTGHHQLYSCVCAMFLLACFWRSSDVYASPSLPGCTPLRCQREYYLFNRLFPLPTRALVILIARNGEKNGQGGSMCVDLIAYFIGWPVSTRWNWALTLSPCVNPSPNVTETAALNISQVTYCANSTFSTSKGFFFPIEVPDFLLFQSAGHSQHAWFHETSIHSTPERRS